jgi:peptidoglycan hydrolase CwlO-like protein
LQQQLRTSQVELQGALAQNAGLQGSLGQLQRTLDEARTASVSDAGEFERKLAEVVKQRDALQKELHDHESQFEGQLSQYKAKINTMLGQLDSNESEKQQLARKLEEEA